MNYKHGMSNTRVFKIWLGMLDRCRNDRNGNYGKCGINVCEVFDSLPSFEDWDVTRKQAIVDFDILKLEQLYKYSIEAGIFNDTGFLAFIHSQRVREEGVSETERRKSWDWLGDNGYLSNENGELVKIVWEHDEAEQ